MCSVILNQALVPQGRIPIAPVDSPFIKSYLQQEAHEMRLLNVLIRVAPARGAAVGFVLVKHAANEGIPEAGSEGRRKAGFITTHSAGKCLCVHRVRGWK